MFCHGVGFGACCIEIWPVEYTTIFFLLLLFGETIVISARLKFFVEAPVKNWEDWKQTKSNEQQQEVSKEPKIIECGNCNNFKSNCSQIDKVLFQPIKTNQWIQNPALVGRYCDLATNCKNFNGEKLT